MSTETGTLFLALLAIASQATIAVVLVLALFSRPTLARLREWNRSDRPLCRPSVEHCLLSRWGGARIFARRLWDEHPEPDDRYHD